MHGLDAYTGTDLNAQLTDGGMLQRVVPKCSHTSLAAAAAATAVATAARRLLVLHKQQLAPPPTAALLLQ
jgi:hypothetical protein